MKPTYSYQRRQINNTRSANSSARQVRSIDVDGVKVFEIQDVISHIEAIDLEPESSLKDKYKLKRLALNNKYRKESAHPNKQNKQNEIQRINSRDDGSYIQKSIEKEQKSNPLQQFRSSIHKLIRHFTSISESIESNRITSQFFYTFFKSRQSLAEKVHEQRLVIKYLYEISYTNYLSYLQDIIKYKQSKYDIYEEAQQLQKIYDFIETEIEDMISIYLKEEQQKIYAIFSQSLIHQTKEIQRRTQSFKEKNKIVNTEIIQEQILLETDQQCEVINQSPQEVNESVNNIHSQLKQLINLNEHAQPSMYLRDEQCPIIEQINEKIQTIQIQVNQQNQENQQDQDEGQLINSKQQRDIYATENEVVVPSQTEQKVEKQPNFSDIEFQQAISDHFFDQKQ